MKVKLKTLMNNNGALARYYATMTMVFGFFPLSLVIIVCIILLYQGYTILI